MSIYEYEVLKVNGEKETLSKFKGKALLIVNTASKCGFTPQFEDLQKLYDRYQNQGLVILAFPCNQFGEQEPGNSQSASDFCQLNYGVDFPVYAKVEVNGANEHPLFRHLKGAAPFKGFDENNGTDKMLKMMISEKYPEFFIGNEIKWNFTKFLIDQNGNVIERYEPSKSPLDFEDDIKKLLS